VFEQVAVRSEANTARQQKATVATSSQQQQQQQKRQQVDDVSANADAQDEFFRTAELQTDSERGR